METNFSKRLIALLLTVLMIFSTVSVTAFATDGEQTEPDQSIQDEVIDEPVTSEFVEVASSDELEDALAAGEQLICIAADFELDRTFYITNDVTIYSAEKHTLTRKADFAGDIFVVGESADGEACSEQVSLAIGDPASAVNDLLVIDGNKENIAEDLIVTGTVFFVCKNGKVDLYPNVTLTNCEKQGNERTLNGRHEISGYPYAVGGAVAIIADGDDTAADGTLNIYGGKYINNGIVNWTYLNENGQSKTGNVYGGVFFNHGKLVVYDGLFDSNYSSSRAAVFYNYRVMYLHKGIVTNNKAEGTGGVIYLPASSGAKLYIGGDYTTDEAQVVFENNSAEIGGAISNSGKLVIRNTSFNENTSVETAGAIHCASGYGNVAIYNSTFIDNKAAKNAGAIYVASSLNSINLQVKDSQFTNNHADKNGGAIYVGNPSKAYIRDVSFTENTANGDGGAVYALAAEAEFNYVIFNGNSATNGGAVALEGDTINEVSVPASVIINKAIATGNTANATKTTGGGGAIHCKDGNVEVYNSEIKQNTAITGSAIYFNSGASGYVYNTAIEGNSCKETNTGNAGAIAAYNGGKQVTLHTCSLKNNSSKGNGGALWASSKSLVDLYNITATGNSASKGGFFYITTTGTLVTVNGATVSGNTATVEGPIVCSNSKGAKVIINKNNYTDSDVTTELDADYWKEALHYCSGTGLKIEEISDEIPTYEDYVQPEYDIKNHEGANHTYVEVVTATCTEDGIKTKECACGDIRFVAEVEALGHDYTEAIISDEFLSEKGETESTYFYNCARCDEVSTEDTFAVVDAEINTKFAEISGFQCELAVEGTDTANVTVKNDTEFTLDFVHKDESIGRNIDAWWVGVKALAPEGMTNEELANATFKSYAGVVYNFMEKKDSADDAERHFITFWLPVTQDSINDTKDGVLTYTCEFDWDGNGYGISTQKINVAIDTNKLVRTHSEGCTDAVFAEKVEATCEDVGYETLYRCDVCGLFKGGDEIAALGHNPVAYDAKAPACTEIGWNAYEACSRCDYTTYVEIPATGHSFGETVAEKAATCTTDGNYAYKQCSACGLYFAADAATDSTDGKADAKSFVIAASNHSYSKTVTAPTCTEDGFTTYTCECGDSYIADYVDEKGHKYTTVVTKATTSKNGKTESKCSVCGAVKSGSTKTIYYPKTIKLEYTSTTYNGKTKTPSVSVKDYKGKTVSSSNYTVSYPKSRKSVGKYSVTITFKGNYSGKVTLYFNILPSKTSKIAPTCATTEIKASWSKVTGASGYKVELLNSKGKVVKSVTTSKTSYTFKKLSKVTTYKVRVTAYAKIDKKTVYSTASTTITTSTAPAKVTLSKVTAGSKAATPAWKTVSGASGYQVQYSTSSKFKSAKTATVKKGSSKKTTIKKLTKGKKYYFKVRAYKTVGSTTVYGAWSSVKSVKVK